MSRIDALSWYPGNRFFGAGPSTPSLPYRAIGMADGGFQPSYSVSRMTAPSPTFRSCFNRLSCIVVGTLEAVWRPPGSAPRANLMSSALQKLEYFPESRFLLFFSLY